MCTSCGSKNYGQDQPDERAKDKARLDKVAGSRNTRQRKSNAHLN